MCTYVVDICSLTLTRGSPWSGTKWATRARVRVFKPPADKVRQTGLICSDVWTRQTEDDDVWFLRHRGEIREED